VVPRRFPSPELQRSGGRGTCRPFLVARKCTPLSERSLAGTGTHPSASRVQDPSWLCLKNETSSLVLFFFPMPPKLRTSLVDIKLGRNGTGTDLSLSGRRYSGNGRVGTRLLITGALHGDEPTAIGAIWYFEEALRRDSVAGAVTVIPCVNPLAAGASTRLVPLEDSDINRSFPGRVDGSLAERTAAALTQLLHEHDALIDVHTAGWCVPFALLDATENKDLYGRITRWAKSAGLPVVAEMESHHAKLQGLNRSWSAWAVAQGKPAFTLELTGFHTLDHRGARRGADALLKLLRAKEVLRSPPSPKKQYSRRYRRKELFAGASGFFEATVQPGRRVKAREPVGWIKSLVGTVAERVVAPSAGLILALQPVSAVHIGSWVATIATSDSLAGLTT